jgi:Family of unknown function (DUF6516)
MAFMVIDAIIFGGYSQQVKAERIFYDKAVLADGSIIEMVLWRLPQPSSDRPHGLKYRLFFGKDGIRIVGYDNERGKGDHKHLGGLERPYRFTSVEQLMEDFLADVAAANGGRLE